MQDVVAQKTMKKPLFRVRQALIFACVLLAACSAPRPNEKPNLAYNPKKDVLPDKVLVRDNPESILDLPLSDDMLKAMPLEKSEYLPDIWVNNFSAIDATATEAFRVLTMDKNIAVSTDDSANDVRINLTNYSGKLQDVVERISETAGVFYTYRNGLLRLSRDRSFIVPLPPLTDAFEDMAGTMSNLGASDLKLDKTSRMITFRANRKVFDSVSSYLERLRNQKVMIVYETYFLEVTLNDAKSTGVNWNQILKKSTSSSSSGSGSGSGTSTTTDGLDKIVDNSNLSFDQAFGNGTPALNIISSGAGMAFGTLFTSGSLNINVLFDFLSQQGNVETISKPTITLLSGGKAKFEVGRKTRFVSRRGVASLSDSSSGTQSTLETEDLSTGLKVEIDGDYSDDSIFTKINLSVNDLIRFDEVGDATTGKISLPETATRSLDTNVRVRPGDAILIAGINQSRDNKSSSGPFIFGTWMPFLNSKSEGIDRSELVIVLKPKIVRFVRENPEPVADKTPAKSVPAAETSSGPVPIEKVMASPLVPPVGAVNMLDAPMNAMPIVPTIAPMPAYDPNISSQLLFMPDGSTSRPVLDSKSLSISRQDSGDKGWNAPLQTPAGSVPDKTINNPNLKLAPIMNGTADNKDEYNAPRRRLPLKSSAENKLPETASGDQKSQDPLVDSFGYYGKNGSAQ